MARALGRYELLRPLARGGMAEVYLARRRAAGVEKWLVVKRMRPETSGDPRFLDLFVREARLSMSLVHQNIVPVFDFGRIDDQVFLAMERVEGKDLGSSLSRARPHRLPPLLAAFVAAECCQALDYAHQRKSPEGVALGVVHRDVTPRNVLLSWSGEVKLTDFGIAALAGEATSRLLGTPQYMAPEQARSEPIDPRADIYAIGLVLREAVTGVRARPGAGRDSILDAARRGELLPWSSPPPQSPAPSPSIDELALGSGEHGPDDAAPDEPPPTALVAIIDRATAALPGDRYPDARSMLEELDSFIVGERAARKAESPARQLAAWLASVWEGARDDVETESSIEGDHLVSFLDDGAFDVIGTGTVRSLAATAADDALAAPMMAGVTTALAAASSTPPRIATPAAGVPAARPPEPAGRPGRISSSVATVASGSFHALAAPGSTPRRPSELQPRARRTISPLAQIVFVGVAAGAAVFFVMNGYRERDRQGSGQPGSGQLNALQPVPAAPAPNPASTRRQDSGLPDTGQPSGEQPHPGRPHAEPPHAGQPHAGSPRSDQATSPAATEHGASSGAAAPGRTRSDPPAPAWCRVTINLTPWAYYTTDDDTTRHETPSTVELAPGRHRLHVWNPELHVERDVALDVPADRDTMSYSAPLQPSAQPPGVAPPP